MTASLAEQTKAAYDFMQKVFHEVSYLMKEVEGLLQQEEEGFIIGRPSGYGATTKTSTGLEPALVAQWLPKTFTVFFGTEEHVKSSQGVTKTDFHPDLRLIILHVDLCPVGGQAPQLLAGVLNHITQKNAKREKFENLMWEFAYNPRKVFANLPNVDYEDGNCVLKGQFVVHDVFTVNSSEDVKKKILDPVLVLFRQKEHVQA